MYYVPPNKQTIIIYSFGSTTVPMEVLEEHKWEPETQWAVEYSWENPLTGASKQITTILEKCLWTSVVRRGNYTSFFLLFITITCHTIFQSLKKLDDSFIAKHITTINIERSKNQAP